METELRRSRLYVGNLDYSVDNEQLKALFSNYGEVKHVNIIKRKGFGFVEMSNPTEAERAKKAMNGQEFEGRPLKVANAHSPNNPPRVLYRRY